MTKIKSGKIILIHAICWIIYNTYAIGMTHLIRTKATFDLGDLIINYILGTCLFYAFVFIVIPRFSTIKKLPAAIFAMLALFAVYCYIRYAFKNNILDPAILIHPFSSYLQAPFIHYCVFIFFEYFIYASGYSFAMDSIRKAKSIKAMEQQRLEIENQLLKEQISPHFLYNTLSYFYTKTLKYDPELADGIVTLTDMLRYSLKLETDKISLSEEVEHIENIIKINKLRFNNQVSVVLTKEFDPETEYEIIPHAFITLVENAFKYGDVMDQNRPLALSVKASDKGINFTVINKKSNATRYKSNGTGLNNLRRRLDLLYREDYSLTIEEKDDTFIADLFIKNIK